MRLIIVRHGQTTENANNIIQGHLHGTLSEKGIMQAEKLALRLKNEKIDIIYSSDLKRAVDTAKIIAKYHARAKLVFAKELREKYQGSLQGKNWKKIDWSNPPPDVETYDQLFKRAKSFLEKIINKHPDKTVLFVTHSRIKMCFINLLKNKPLGNIANEHSPENTAVSIFEIKKNNKIKEIVLNCVKHLYPSEKECISWYKEIGTPENIIRHAKAVNKVAVFLAKELIKKGIKININVVDKASLLHDLDKWLCIQDKSIEHGFETEKMLTKKGYPELGYYARQHRGDLIKKGYNTWEEKIISYADKRVLEDKIVGLKKRFEYINKKYPAQDINERESEIDMYYKLEKEIFSCLDFGPDSLAEVMENKADG